MDHLTLYQRGGRLLCPSHYYLPPCIFRSSYGPAKGFRYSKYALSTGHRARKTMMKFDAWTISEQFPLKSREINVLALHMYIQM